MSRHTTSIDDVCPNEGDSVLFLDFFLRDRLCLLGEIIGAARMYRWHAEGLGVRGPTSNLHASKGQDATVGWFWRLVNEVGVELACVTPFCKVNAIMHHGGPIIAHSCDAITQLMAGLVCTTHTSVSFLHYLLRFLFALTPYSQAI